MNRIKLKEIASPKKEIEILPISLSAETMNERKDAVLKKMRENGYDSLVIYADIEHGGNFEYLTGFSPRFEEALLILHLDKKSFLVLGNENLKMEKYSRISADAVHSPYFSLPNQPMETDKSFKEILKETNIHQSNKIGLVGWKNFTSKKEDNLKMFDIPYFIVDSLKELCTKSTIENASSLFIGDNGVRTTNNANEIAYYEFGAALAGNCIIEAMNSLEIGISEMKLAETLSGYGQRHNVVTIMAAGERFINANVYPTGKCIQIGDRISMTTGYKGGLQSRSGYAVMSQEQLPNEEKDYIEKVAKPYFYAIKTWLEKIKIGMTGSQLYDCIEEVLPKEKYGWKLNPGHLTADEEWMSSPIYKGSSEKLKNGMMLQIDIIPSVKGYAGASAESGIILANEELRNSIKNQYPDIWKRMEERREFMINNLGIHISEEVLLTSNAVAYYRPFFLNKKLAFVSEIED